MYSGATGLWERIRESWRDPMVRRNAGYLMAGKMIGLGLVLLLISKWYLPATAYADTAPALPPPHSQRDQHGLDAGRRIPGFLHAGRLRHARVGIRPLA